MSEWPIYQLGFYSNGNPPPPPFSRLPSTVFNHSQEPMTSKKVLIKKRFPIFKRPF